MNKIEFFKDIIEDYEELLRELENENAPIDAIELVKESIRTNKILLENCILREEETKVLEVAEDSAPEEDSGLTVGRVFKNYKELCKFMGWKPTGGDYKKARLKELDTLCKWHKEGNKIIIDDVFAEVKNKEDGRSKNNVFVNPVEVILLFALKDSEKSEVYFSNSKIYRLLGLFNERYAELQYSDTSYIVEELIVDYLTVKSFKINSKSEANKIIKRALESLRK